MGMWVPEEVRTLFKVLTGEEWPAVDEDALRRLGDAWDHAAGRIESELTPLVNTTVSGIRAEFSGDAERGFASSMAAFTTEPPYYFDTGTKHYRTMGKFGRDTATMVNYVKIMIIAQLVVLVVEIAVYTALSFVTFGASLAWLAARFAIVRFLINTFLGRLLLRIALAQLIGVGLQVALDAIVQRIQLDTGWRDKWDPSLTRQAAEVGALGGVIGLGLGPMSGLVGKIAGKTFGSTVARTVGKAVGEFVEEGLSESLTEMFYTASQGGGWKFNPYAFTAGMTEGVAQVGGKGLGKLLFPGPGAQIGPNVPLSDVLEAHNVPVTLDTVESIRTGTESPATKVLERYGIPTGPGTAYAIAASAGLVPSTGNTPLPVFTGRGVVVPEAVRSWFTGSQPEPGAANAAGTATTSQPSPAPSTVAGTPDGVSEAAAPSTVTRTPDGVSEATGHATQEPARATAQPESARVPEPQSPPSGDTNRVFERDVVGAPVEGPPSIGQVLTGEPAGTGGPVSDGWAPAWDGQPGGSGPATPESPGSVWDGRPEQLLTEYRNRLSDAELVHWELDRARPAVESEVTEWNARHPDHPVSDSGAERVWQRFASEVELRAAPLLGDAGPARTWDEFGPRRQRFLDLVGAMPGNVPTWLAVEGRREAVVQEAERRFGSGYDLWSGEREANLATIDTLRAEFIDAIEDAFDVHYATIPAGVDPAGQDFATHDSTWDTSFEEAVNGLWPRFDSELRLTQALEDAARDFESAYDGYTEDLAGGGDLTDAGHARERTAFLADVESAFRARLRSPDPTAGRPLDHSWPARYESLRDGLAARFVRREAVEMAQQRMAEALAATGERIETDLVGDAIEVSRDGVAAIRQELDQAVEDAYDEGGGFRAAVERLAAGLEGRYRYQAGLEAIHREVGGWADRWVSERQLDLLFDGTDRIAEYVTSTVEDAYRRTLGPLRGEPYADARWRQRSDTFTAWRQEYLQSLGTQLAHGSGVLETLRDGGTTYAALEQDYDVPQSVRDDLADQFQQSWSQLYHEALGTGTGLDLDRWLSAESTEPDTFQDSRRTAQQPSLTPPSAQAEALTPIQVPVATSLPLPESATAQPGGEPTPPPSTVESASGGRALSTVSQVDIQVPPRERFARQAQLPTADTGSSVHDIELKRWAEQAVDDLSARFARRSIANGPELSTLDTEFRRELTRITDEMRAHQRSLRAFHQVEQEAGHRLLTSVLRDPDYQDFATSFQAWEQSTAPVEEVAAERQRLHDQYRETLSARGDAWRDFLRTSRRQQLDAVTAFRGIVDRAQQQDSVVIDPGSRTTLWQSFRRQWEDAGRAHLDMLWRRAEGDRTRPTSPALAYLQQAQAGVRRSALEEQFYRQLVGTREQSDDTSAAEPAAVPRRRGRPSQLPRPSLETIAEVDESDLTEQRDTRELAADTQPVALDPAAVVDFGIPERLDGVAELHEALRAAVPAATGVPPRVELEQRLRLGYRKLSEDGLLLALGDGADAREVRIRLERTDPRLVTGHGSNGHEVITGVHDGVWNDAGQSVGSDLSVELSVPVGIGLGTDAVVRTVAVTPSVKGAANNSKMSATSDTTAFVSQVTDNRGLSELVQWNITWHVTVTKADETGRDETTPLDVDQAAGVMTLWTPHYYLAPAPPVTTAESSATLPKNVSVERISATGLLDEALRLLGPTDAPVGSKARAALLRFLDGGNQASVLRRAAGERGAELVVTDDDGVVTGVLRQRTALADWHRVGTASNKGHIEDVHVDAAKMAGGSELSQVSGAGLAAKAGLFGPVEKFGVGLGVGGRLDRGVTDSLSAGGVGLGVTVGRYAGFTLGYRARTTTTLVFEPLGTGNLPRASEPVTGTVQLRLREPEAVAHGLPVEQTAADRAAAREAERERHARQEQESGRPLRHPPAMVLANRGLGMAIVEDLTGADALLDRIYEPLAARGFLPPRDPATHRYQLRDGDGDARRRLARQFDNLAKLTGTVSQVGLTAQFEPAMQHGIPVLLTDPQGRHADVTVGARLRPDGWTVRGPSRELQVVKLWISSDSPGGGRSIGNTVEGHVRVGATGPVALGPLKVSLPAWTGKLRAGRSHSIGSGSTINNVELLETKDAALEYRFGVDLTVQIHEPGTAEPVWTGTAENEHVTLRIIEDVSGHTAQTLEPHASTAPRERSDAEQSLFQKVGFVMTDTIAVSGLQDAFRQVLPAELTGPGTGAWSTARAFGNVENVRSHLEQLVDGHYVTDNLFVGRKFRDHVGQLEMSLNLGRPQYRAKSGSGFVSGNIMYGANRAEHASARKTGSETAWDVLGAEVAVAGKPSASLSRSMSAEDATKTARSTSAAVERLSLHFGPVYQFSADALFTVKGLAVRRNRFSDGSAEPRTTHVAESDGYWFWLRETDTLRLYLEGDLDVPDSVVEEALWRDQNGDRDLPETTVAGLLGRFAAGELPLGTDTVATVLSRHLGGDLDLPDDTVEGVLRAHVAHDIDLTPDAIAALRDRHELPAELLAQLDDRNLPSEWALPAADRQARDLLERYPLGDPDPAAVTAALERHRAGGFALADGVVDTLVTAWESGRLDIPFGSIVDLRLANPDLTPRSTADRLRDHARGGTRVPDAEVEEALARHLAGAETLTSALVGKLAAQYGRGTLTLSEPVVATMLDAYEAGTLRLPDTVVAGVRRRHFAQPPQLTTAIHLAAVDRQADVPAAALDTALDAWRRGGPALPPTAAIQALREHNAGQRDLTATDLGGLLAVPSVAAAPEAVQARGRVAAYDAARQAPEAARRAREALADRGETLPPHQKSLGEGAQPQLPEYMLADKPTFGFGAPERVVLDRPLPRVIRDLLRQVAPEAVADRSVSRVLGLARQIGDQYSTPGVRALVDNLFGSGLRLAFVNRRGLFGAELVHINLTGGPLSDARPVGQQTRAGMENYAYANHKVSRSWTHTDAATTGGRLASGGNATEQGTQSLTGSVSYARTRSTSTDTTASDTITSAHTVFDWSGNRDFAADFQVRVEVTRSPMPGRPLNKVYTATYSGLREAVARDRRPVRVVADVPGSLTWRLPKGLSDAPRGTSGPLGADGQRVTGTFDLPTQFYPEAITGLDELLDTAQRTVGRQALAEATRNGQTVAWFVGAHAMRANLDRVVSPEGYDFRGLLDPGTVADTFKDLNVRGILRDPVKVREFDSMALGWFLKNEAAWKTSSTTATSHGLTFGLTETNDAGVADPSHAGDPGGKHNADVSDTGGLGTALSASQGAERSTRDESHVKQTGKTWLVKAELDLTLTATTRNENMLWSGTPRPRPQRSTTSTVYLHLFETDAKAIFAQLGAVTGEPVSAASPVAATHTSTASEFSEPGTGGPASTGSTSTVGQPATAFEAQAEQLPAATLHGRGLRSVAVLGDGDCFFVSVLATAPSAVLTALQRRYGPELASTLETLAGESLPELVRQQRQGRLDASRRSALYRVIDAMRRAAAEVIAHGVVPPSEVGGIEVTDPATNEPVPLTDANRAEQAALVRRRGFDGSHHDGMSIADYIPDAVATALGLPLGIVNPDGSVTALNVADPAGPVHHVVYNGHNHYDATERIP